jgi:hypothetical protein
MEKDCVALVIGVKGNCLHASWYMDVVDPAPFIVSLTPREFSLAA